MFRKKSGIRKKNQKKPKKNQKKNRILTRIPKLLVKHIWKPRQCGNSHCSLSSGVRARTLVEWNVILGIFGDTNVERKRCTYDVTLTSLTGLSNQRF